MTRAYIDFDPPQPDAPDFEHDTADLVYFLSWAYAMRFGANHELSIAALVLKTEFEIDLAPLLTFADRDVEDDADREALTDAWQAAAPLAACCEQVSRAFTSGEQHLQTLTQDYPSLEAGIVELGQLAAWGARRGARIRLSYEMEQLA